MTNERNGKPSASGFSRLALCPGSWNLESTLPEQEANQYMQLGTDVHAVLADQKPFEELTEEGQEIATRCLNDFSTLIGQLDLGERTKEVIEERFWYTDELLGEDTFSGAIDRIDFFGDEVAVVTDYKTGRTAQSKASDNKQLMAYAVLVKKAFPELKTIFVAIIQPLAGGTTIAEYNEAELAAANKEICGIVLASSFPNAPRNPSPDACKWCRAKGICPDAYGQAQAATTTLQVASSVAVSTLSNEELASLDAKSLIVEDFIDEIRKELKARLMGGAQIAGLSLGKGRITRNVTDTAAAISALLGFLSHDAVMDCAKLSVSSLEKAVAKAKGLKGKDAKAALDDALGWIIETKESEPSLQRDRK